MNKKAVSVGSTILILLLAMAWWLGYFGGTDPAVAELQRERDEAFARMDTMTEEERREHFGNFRERVQNLSDDQRRQFFESSQPMFQQMMNQRLNRFFAMSPEEQQKELDEMIDRREQFRRARENGDQDRGGRGGPGFGGGGRGGMRGKGGLDRTTPEMRAKFDTFRDMMRDRMAQRGIERR